MMGTALTERKRRPEMDALIPFIAIVLVALLAALASLDGADTRDGFDGRELTLPPASPGPRVAL